MSETISDTTTPMVNLREQQARRLADAKRDVVEATAWVRENIPRDTDQHVDGDKVLALRTLVMDTLGEYLTAVETESMLFDNLLVAKQSLSELTAKFERQNTRLERLETMQADPHGPVQ
jgi:hypothetical protein